MISIVDDDISVREATKGWVRSLGYGAAAFASAEEFLQSGKVNDTECVITDVQMPGLSGIELQSHLISQGNRPGGGLLNKRAAGSCRFPATERRGRSFRRVL